MVALPLHSSRQFFPLLKTEAATVFDVKSSPVTTKEIYNQHARGRRVSLPVTK